MGVTTRAFIKTNAKGDIYAFLKNYMTNMTIRDHQPFKSIQASAVYGTFLGEGKMVTLSPFQFGGVYVDEDEDWYYNEYQTREESDSYFAHQLGIPDNTPGMMLLASEGDYTTSLFYLLIEEFGGWIKYADTNNEPYEEVSPEQYKTWIKWMVRKNFKE
jgi:hypothetical protein